MPIRLIALDLDGTLLDDNKQISAATRDALHAAAARDVHIVLASGRMTPAITPVADDLAVDGPLTRYNGPRGICPAAARPTKTPAAVTGGGSPLPPSALEMPVT